MQRVLTLVAQAMFTVCAIGMFAPQTRAQTDFPETLVIATNSDYPPFILKDQKSSFLPDLLKKIGDEMGVTFELRYLPWQRCEQQVQSHDAWGALPYTRNEDREKIYAFSDPMYQIDAKFFAYDAKGTKKQIRYNRLRDLEGWRIGGIQGYYYEPMFAAAGLDVDYAHSEEQNIKRLQLNRIDLTPLPGTIGWYLIKKLFPDNIAENFYTLEKPLVSNGTLHLMTSKSYPGNAILMARFNAALAKIKTNGTFADVVAKHGLVLGY